MARVPRHFRDKLVSSQTGVNTLDTSGADTARAISKMADQFQVVAGGFLRKQKESTDRSEIASKKAEYVNKSAIAAQEIQKSFAENPEEGFKTLTERNQKIKEEVLSDVSDGRLQTEIGSHIDGLAAQQSITNKKWEINRMSAMEQQFLVDVQQMNVDTVMQGATADEYKIMLEDDTFTEENYKKAWGPEEGIKNFRTAQNAMFRARATTLMESGRFFDAQDFIQKSEEPDEKTRREVEKNFIKMQKGAEAKRFFETVSAASVDVVETIEGVSLDQLTASQLDDKVLDVSATAAQTTDPAQKKVLTDYANTLADIRDIKMEQILLTSAGDVRVEARLQAQYETLFRRRNDQIERDPNAYLSDFFLFQKDLVAEAKAGNVSATNLNKWVKWSQVALQGVDPSKKGFFGGLTTNIEREDVSVRKKVEAFVRDFEDRDVSWRMGVLQEVYEALPQTGFDNMNQEKIDAFFTRAKNIATLRELGYPVDILDSKVIKTPAGNFNVVSFNQDGMPVLDVSTQNRER
jgi:hypothetical protein